MNSSPPGTNPPVQGKRMSKHALAKLILTKLETGCEAESIDRDEGVEALLTLCIQDMQRQRGSGFARDYLQFELSSLGSGGVFDVQKR